MYVCNCGESFHSNQERTIHFSSCDWFALYEEMGAEIIKAIEDHSMEEALSNRYVQVTIARAAEAVIGRNKDEIIEFNDAYLKSTGEWYNRGVETK